MFFVVVACLCQGVKVAVKELEMQKLHVNRDLLLEIKQVGVDKDKTGPANTLSSLIG